MKKSLLAIVFLLAGTVAFTQDSIKNVSWVFNAEKKSGDTYVLNMKASIANGWRLFSTGASEDEPNTRIQFDSATRSAISINSIEESPNLKTAREPLFDNLEIKYFETEAEIKATVTITGDKKNISGVVSYMTMKGDEVTSPVDEPFRFSFDAAGNLVTVNAGLQESAAALDELKRDKI
jgi:hypothetical protein